MSYVASYQRPYEGGYVNLPSEDTPEMAEFINARDDTLIKIEKYLETFEPEIEEIEGYVPDTRKIAGIDLTDDISKEELVASERTVKGEVYVKFANQEEVEVELPEYLPYPKDNKEGQKGQFLISNGDGSTSWISIEMAEGGAY